MINFFLSLSNPVKALLACMFTYLITALGAAVVFFFKKMNKNVLDAMLGLAARSDDSSIILFTFKSSNINV